MIIPCDRLGRRRPRARKRPGTATVELAVILTLFLAVFIYGMIEVSRAIIVVEVLNDAARAGCRQGVQSGNSNSNITTAVDAVMKANNLPIYEPVVITIDDPLNATATDASQASSGSKISVQVSIKAKNFSYATYFFLHSSAQKGQTDSVVASHNLTMRKQ